MTKVLAHKWLYAFVLVTASLAAAACVHARSQLDRIPLYRDDPTRPDLLGSLYQRYYSLRILRGVGDELRSRSKSDLELVKRAVDWTHMHVRGQGSSPPDLVYDNTLGLIVRGRGWCDQVAAVAGTILWSQGLPVRLLALENARGSSPHTALEVRLGGKWIVVDPWYGTSMLRDGAPVSAAEVDQALLDTWGIDIFEPADYHRGWAWRVFPFLDARAVADRIRARIPGARASVRSPAPSPPVLSIPEVKNASGSVAAVATVPEHSLSSPEVRRAFVRARLRDLRGDDATTAYSQIAVAAVADPDLAGAATYFALLHAVERSRPVHDFAVPGAWQPSGVELRARVLRDTLSLNGAFSPRTVAQTILSARPAVGATPW